jgi:Putative auto-transporter adhesin, head GIN domain
MKKSLLLIMSATVLFASCNFIGGKRVKGNGNVKTEERNVSNFKNVEVHGSIDVFVTSGDLKPVRIEGDENLLQYVEVVEQGDKLEVRSRSGYNLSPTAGMKIYLTAPEFGKIDVSGACNITGQNQIKSSDGLQLEVSGAGDIKMNVNAPKVASHISGSGSMVLSGETKELDVELSGAGKAHCFDLLAENTTIDISGAGEAEVYASQKLNAEVSGAGSVKYKGGVKNISQRVSGAGNVTRVE